MKPSVLLVEDDSDGRLALGAALERRGFSCTLARSVDEGLAALAPSIDVVVTDIVLGEEERGGLSVLQASKKRSPQTPVILITAFANLEVVKAALNAGAGFLLEKPFRADALVQVAHRLLEETQSVEHLVERSLDKVALTEKEAQVARLLLKGLTSAEIAALLKNSDKTIRQHVGQIYAKFGVASRGEFFHHVFPS